MAALTPDRADFTTDFRMRNGSGRLMWMHSAGRGEFADDGRLRRLHGVIRNITNQKQREEQVQFLMREVNHRSKNMLSLVLAVARQTVSQERDDFVRRFEERIQSLALCQDLLVKSDWAGVPIGDLVHSQLAHFKDLIGRRIEIDGVHLDLSASAAQTLGMAVHELATNAGKYGALSNGVGRVVIQWRVDDHRAEQPGFELSWSEVDGPKVEMPLRKGFGSKVIGNMVRLGLGGDAETDYAETGLRWRLRCPVQNVVVSETPHVSVLGNIHQSYDDHVLREDNPSI
jgi:two-component sensor histidine kinase